jgi:hypothetical protein
MLKRLSATTRTVFEITGGSSSLPSQTLGFFRDWPVAIRWNLNTQGLV